MSTPTPQCWYAMYIAIFVSCHTPHPPSHKSHLILCPTQVQVSSLRIQFATCVTNMQDYIASQITLPLHLLQTIGFNFFYFLLEKKPVDITRQALNCILFNEGFWQAVRLYTNVLGIIFIRLYTSKPCFPLCVKESKACKTAKICWWQEKFSSALVVFLFMPRKSFVLASNCQPHQLVVFISFSFNVVPHIFSLIEHSNATMLIRNVYCNFWILPHAPPFITQIPTHTVSHASSSQQFANPIRDLRYEHARLYSFPNHPSTASPWDNRFYFLHFARTKSLWTLQGKLSIVYWSKKGFWQAVRLCANVLGIIFIRL